MKDKLRACATILLATVNFRPATQRREQRQHARRAPCERPQQRPELLRGSHFDDLLAGGAGDDRIIGGHRADNISDGTGLDEIWGGAGRDLIDVKDSARDMVSCGRDRDGVSIDRHDRVTGCEKTSPP